MRGTVLLASLIMLALPTGGAGAADLSKTYEACLAHENSNPAWAACGAEEIARQEKRLNKAWSKKLECFDRSAEPWQKLLEDQRLWVKWKDSACRFYGASEKNGGPMYGREGQVLHGPACLAGIIADRADFLDQLCVDR